ncbi:MAG: single-stranded DNA-binding protein [Ancrocorticia sp.]
MSNETYVTVRGYVGAVPTMFGADPQRSTVVIRVGVTARRFNREANEYTNGETAWYAVRCFGTLGQHVARSVQRGTPVLVRGRLVPRLWVDKDGVQRTEFNILADAVGIELSTGVGHFIHARLTEPPKLDGVPGQSAANVASSPASAAGTEGGAEAGDSGSTGASAEPGRSSFQAQGSYSVSGSFAPPEGSDPWEVRDMDGELGIAEETESGDELVAENEVEMDVVVDPAGHLANVSS